MSEPQAPAPAAAPAPAEPSLSTIAADLPRVFDYELDRDDVIENLRNSCEFFVNFFLGEEITTPVPAFHVNIWDCMTSMDVLRYACAVPRGHAKTTLAKLVCVWHLLFTKVRYIVYVSNTELVAANAVSDIIAFIESDNFIAIFGAAHFTRRQENRGQFLFSLNMGWDKARGAGERDVKFCILMARGANQQVRGLNIQNQRPQLAIVDDLEDLDNTETERVQKNLERWFLGTFMKAMDKKWYRIVYVGNLIHSFSILNKLLSLDSWSHLHLGAILSNGQPLWPELWSLSDLMEDYKEYQKFGQTALWFAEMMNLVIAAENALIKPDKIHYLPPAEPEDIAHAFITIDPIPEKTGTRDRCAIVVHGLRQMADGVGFTTQIVEYTTGRWGVYEAFEETYKLALKWRATVIGIESVAFSATWLIVFKTQAMVRGILDWEIVKLMAAQKKTMRISGWCALLQDKTCALTTGDMEIVSQLLMYDVLRRDNNDDLIDAAAYVTQMLEQYLGLILSSQPLNAAIDVTPLHEDKLCDI